MKKKMIVLFLVVVLSFVGLSGCFETSIDIPGVIDFTSADLEVAGYEVTTSWYVSSDENGKENGFPSEITGLPDTTLLGSYSLSICVKGDVLNKQDYRAGHFYVHVIFYDSFDMELFREADALCCIKPGETMEFEVYATDYEHAEELFQVDHVGFEFEIIFNSELIKEFESYDLDDIEIVEYSVRTNWYYGAGDYYEDGFYHGYPEEVRDTGVNYVIDGTVNNKGDKMIEFNIIADFYDINGNKIFTYESPRASVGWMMGPEAFQMWVNKYNNYVFDDAVSVELRIGEYRTSSLFYYHYTEPDETEIDGALWAHYKDDDGWLERNISIFKFQELLVEKELGNVIALFS